jgi:lipid-A-disaccharide synthase
VFEIVPKIIDIKKRIDQTVAEIVRTKPDALVTIDAPDFCFRVAKRVSRRMGPDCPKIIHYVAPTVWAWRPGRAKKIASFLDGLLCLLPFEPPYFEKEGLKSAFIGHPMVEGGIMEADPALYRRSRNIPDDALVVGILPGSRSGELRRTGAVLFDAIRHSKTDLGKAHIIVPTLPHLKEIVEEICRNVPGTLHIETDTSMKYSAFRACGAALATSGTVGLELAVAGVPHSIAYRINPATWHVVDKMIYAKYAHLANNILGKELVPEYLQHDCRPEILAVKLDDLINDKYSRSLQMAGFEQVRQAIGAYDKVYPSQKAAAFIREILDG